MTRDEFIALSAEYAAGGLQGDELEKFMAYVRTATPQELEELAELLTTTSLLPLALHRKAPPAHVREQLLQSIRLSGSAREAVEERTEELMRQALPRALSAGRQGGWRAWMPLGVTFVGLAMVLAFALYVMGLLRTIDGQNQRLVAIQDELSRKEELLNVLAAKQVEMVLMSGLANCPVGYGKIIWDPERRVAILQVSNLPPVSSDKDYQLWVIKSAGGGQPISAGVFAIGTTEPAYFKIEQLAVTDPKQIAAFAITLEPKGGVPAPTGAMYMAGSPKL